MNTAYMIGDSEQSASEQLRDVNCEIRQTLPQILFGIDDDNQRNLKRLLLGLYEKKGILLPQVQRRNGVLHGMHSKLAFDMMPDSSAVKVRFLGVCHRCKKQHEEITDPWGFNALMEQWNYKHKDCALLDSKNVETFSMDRNVPKGFDDTELEKLGVGPWWLTYGHNADIKLAYAADAAFTLDLSALAASSTLVVGRESSSVTNDTAGVKMLDYKISGSFISGTTPTAGGEARLSGVQPQEDTPTWPDVFDGTDSAETITNTAIRDKLPILWSGDYSTSSNIPYPIVSSLTLAQAFGIVPHHFEVFFAHSMTAALKTDAANTNGIFYKGVYATST